MAEVSLLLIRCVLLLISFAGLCAFFRAHWSVDRFIAPLVAASSIILLTMLFGMMGLLKYGVYLLFALGFAGLVYACAVRRVRLDLPLLLLGALFTVFLSWRFFGATLRHYDDFSHWGLVVRHLLNSNRFPGPQDAYIKYQSYPLGTACFIYYVARLTTDAECVYLIAHNLLIGIAFLPLFALVRRRKRLLYPLLAAVFFVLFSYSCQDANLLVDVMQTFWGIGIAAAIVAERNDYRRAFLSAMPAMIAVAYVKNSGLFFALCGSVMLIAVARRTNALSKRRLRLALLLPIVAYIAWMLYIRLHFPRAFYTTHAVSLINYARRLLHKNLAMIGGIALSLLKHFFQAHKTQQMSIALFLFCLPALGFSLSRLSPNERRRYLRASAACVGTYLVWYFLLFLMYIFSMPESEAKALAGINRYDSTGYSYAAGLIVILTLCALQRRELALPKARRAGAALALLPVVAVIAAALLPANSSMLRAYLPDNAPRTALRADMQALRAEAEVPPNELLLVVLEPDTDSGYLYQVSKLEFQADNIMLACIDPDEPGKYEGYVPFHSVEINRLRDFFSHALDSATGVILLEDSPEIEAELAAAQAGRDAEIPVYRRSALPSH